MRSWRWRGASSDAFIAQTDKQVREDYAADDVIAGVQA
jgi:hypothetical protein